MKIKQRDINFILISAAATVAGLAAWEFVRPWIHSHLMADRYPTPQKQSTTWSFF